MDDLTNGKELTTMPVSQSNPQASIRWLGSHLLVEDVLYDPERTTPVWTYQCQGEKVALGNYLIAGFPNEKGSSAGIFRLPHDEALRVADEIDPKTAYALTPGDNVRVVYELGATPGDLAQQVRAAVEAKFASNRWNINDSAPIVAKIKISQGKQDEAEYYQQNGMFPSFAPPGFGPRPTGPKEKVTFTPWTHEFEIIEDGTSVFKTVAVYGAPNNLQNKDGESTQAAVTRVASPTPAYFANLAIPPHLLRGKYQGGLGKSTLDVTGMR
jgi:hypothetical protein